MAPGLNGGGQSSKNKCACSNTGGRFRVSVRDVLANAATLPWETEPERRRRSANTLHHHQEQQITCSCNSQNQDHQEPRLSTASTASLVDNDNGELSWSSNQSRTEGLLPARSNSRATRQIRAAWMSAERPNAPSPSQGGSSSGRSNPPNRQHVANKLAALQEYIVQTEAVMRELRATDAPGCQEQHEKLSSLLADLRDSEIKLQALLRNMDNVDAKIDQLLNNSALQGSSMNGEGTSEDGMNRRAEEHSRKVQALERQREDLLEMHRVAQQRLSEAEQDRDDLLLRAQAINVAGDKDMMARIQNFRLDNPYANPPFREPAEHPDEDRAEAELSDTETDYQLVRDKVQELNALKGQLSQLQTMMASLAAGGSGRERSRDSSDRGSTQRDFDEAAARVTRMQELNRMVDVIRLQEGEPGPSREQRSIDSEMEQMTRQLEEQTAKMKAERDSLLHARAHLQKLKHLAQARINSAIDDCSGDESETEPPTLLPANMSTPRNAEEDGGGRHGGRTSQEGSVLRVPPRTRQRSTLNQSLPTLVNVPPEPLERRRKEGSSESSVRNGDGARRRADLSDWSPDMINSEAMYQTQNQLEESAQLCEQMLQESSGRGAGSVSSGGPAGDLTGILYCQQQMLTRTVSQCCKLLWLQQRQINELRNAVLLQQSASGHASAPPTAAAATATPSSAPVPECLPLFPIDVPPQLPPQLLSDIMRLRLYDNPLPPPANGQVLDCLSPEESGALNNQVPPGNRANNYWDNFRSYSRQNLLSTRKSNENSDPRRQASNHDRTPQAIVPPNNQSQYPVVQVQPLRQSDVAFALEQDHPPAPRASESVSARNNRTCEVVARRGESEDSRGRNNQGPIRNRQATHDARRDATPDDSPTNVRNNSDMDSQLDASWPDSAAEAAAYQLGGRADSRFVGFSWKQDPDTNVHRVRNNTGAVVRNRARARARDDTTARTDDTLTRVRNDTGATPRNRPGGSEPPDPSSDDIARPNNRFALGNLNNRPDSQTPLRMPTSVYQEINSFIRANETRPNYLIQLFRDLQLVNSDPQRQRALQSLQDVVSANNIAQEARSNIRHDNRSNLRRLTEETEAVDQLFDQLRDNQNTIRQNIGNTPLDSLASNLENPNISNIRELSHAAPASTSSSSSSRNNLEHNRMRDIQSYFEGNFSHGGTSSKNPNLSNNRENLTETLSEYERMNPKNVYRSLYDSLVEDLRRRGEDELYGLHPTEPPMIPVDGESFFMMADTDREERPYDLQSRDATGYLGGISYPNEGFDVRGDTPSRKPFVFPQVNSSSGEDEVSVSRSQDWHAPLPTADNPYTMFVRPVRYQETAILAADDADLAEADQTRSADGDSLPVFRLTKQEENELADIPNDDITREEIFMASFSTEADANENIIANDGGNSNVSKSSTKNRRDMTTDASSGKVNKTRLQDALSGVSDDVSPNPPQPMMDIAGALEHLSDLRPQREEGSFVANDPNLGMEVEAEREAGLDQVPTRLQKSDCPTVERDGSI